MVQFNIFDGNKKYKLSPDWSQKGAHLNNGPRQLSVNVGYIRLKTFSIANSRMSVNSEGPHYFNTPKQWGRSHLLMNDLNAQVSYNYSIYRLQSFAKMRNKTFQMKLDLGEVQNICLLHFFHSCKQQIGSSRKWSS